MSNYYDDYDDYDYDDYDYDPWDHMTNDPVDFAMHGYGGFGYDTSHIQQDEKQSEMCIAASKGDLNTVKQLVNTAAAISDDEKHKVINYALRWTEVDYRMSGFTKEYEWFDLTPVASAAKMGHHEVVEYLLREGADPLLEGYPEDDKESLCAMFCALRHRNGLKMKKQEGQQLNNAQRCLDLLLVANLYWKKAEYKWPRYSKNRDTFTNRATDREALHLALTEDVANISQYPDKKLDGTPKLRKSKSKSKPTAAALPTHPTANGTSSKLTFGSSLPTETKSSGQFKYEGTKTKKQPPSSGKAVDTPSFSFGSNEKKKNAAAKTSSPPLLKAFDQFKLNDEKDATKPSTKSTNKSPQNSSYSFGSTGEGNTSAPTFQFDSPRKNSEVATNAPFFSLGSNEKVKNSSRKSTPTKTSSLFRGQITSDCHLAATIESPQTLFSFGNSSGSCHSKELPSSVPQVASASMFTHDPGSNSNKLVSIESAISLLESLPMSQIMPHHKMRLEALLERLNRREDRKC